MRSKVVVASVLLAVGLLGLGSGRITTRLPLPGEVPTLFGLGALLLTWIGVGMLLRQLIKVSRVRATLGGLAAMLLLSCLTVGARRVVSMPTGVFVADGALRRCGAIEVYPDGHGELGLRCATWDEVGAILSPGWAGSSFAWVSWWPHRDFARVTPELIGGGVDVRFDGDPDTVRFRAVQGDRARNEAILRAIDGRNPGRTKAGCVLRHGAERADEATAR